MNQLASWLGVGVGVLQLLLSAFQYVKSRAQRGQRKRLVFSCWKIGGIERTRLVITDDIDSSGSP